MLISREWPLSLEYVQFNSPSLYLMPISCQTLFQANAITSILFLLLITLSKQQAFPMHCLILFLHFIGGEIEDYRS